MEPQRGSQATLEDLLERVLDKGIVLKLDLIIGLAGIPLIGISLQGAIAAVETMLDYGMMEAWDADTRAYAVREERRREFGFQPGEHPVLDLYGSYHRRRGISRVWQPGRLILTDRRLLLVRSAPPEVLFETLVSAIVGIGRVVHENLGAGRREIVSLALADGTMAGIYAAKPDLLEARLREGIRRLGQAVTEIPAAQLERLDLGAVAGGQLWHRWVPGRGSALWKSGWAALTGTELTWRGDPPQGALLRVPLTGIWGVTIERREFGTLGVRDVLVITRGAGGTAPRPCSRVRAFAHGMRRSGERRLPATGTAMLDLEEGNLRQGLLALVVALLEVVKEALVHAALRRVEGGRLNDAEVERLGDALAELEEAVAQIKAEHGVEKAVQGVRDDLDEVVSKLIDTMIGRERWSSGTERTDAQRA